MIRRVVFHLGSVPASRFGFPRGSLGFLGWLFLGFFLGFPLQLSETAFGEACILSVMYFALVVLVRDNRVPQKQCFIHVCMSFC